MQEKMKYMYQIVIYTMIKKNVENNDRNCYFRMVREDLTNVKNEGLHHVEIWEKDIPDRENNKCKEKG